MNKLAIVTPNLINKCQATFIKGCSNFNQIDLVSRMIDLCELVNQDRAIIALDQEKAYDRIQHDYLWKTLQATNILEAFTNTVRSLYMSARSLVILNGEMSK